MKKFALISLFFCCFSGFVSAQETYNLQQILEIGLEKNYDIRIIRNEQKIADNNTTRGNAGMLPTISASAGYSGSLSNTDQKRTDGSEQSFDNSLSHGTNVGLNLNWTIFDGFRMQTEYARLKTFQQMGEIQARMAIENLIANLTAEYYNYVRQTLRLKNLKYAVSLSKERLRIVEASYTMGSMSRLDLLQARVDFNADSSNLIKQNEVINTSVIVINQLMALEDVSHNWLVGDTAIVPNILSDQENLWQKTMESNARLLLFDKNKSLSELDLKAVQSRNFPYLRLNAGYGYTVNLYSDNPNLSKQSNLGLNYGLTLGYNLFDGMNRRREQKNARIVIQNKDLERQNIELSLKADLANLRMAYQNNMQLTDLETENLQVATQNYEIAMERYRLGDLAGIELREAQNNLLAAEERLLQAKFNTKLCEISLLQISGQLGVLLE